MNRRQAQSTIFLGPEQNPSALFITLQPLENQADLSLLESIKHRVSIGRLGNQLLEEKEKIKSKMII